MRTTLTSQETFNSRFKNADDFFSHFKCETFETFSRDASRQENLFHFTSFKHSQIAAASDSPPIQIIKIWFNKSSKQAQEWDARIKTNGKFLRKLKVFHTSPTHNDDFSVLYDIIIVAIVYITTSHCFMLFFRSLTSARRSMLLHVKVKSNETSCNRFNDLKHIFFRLFFSFSWQVLYAGLLSRGAVNLYEKKSLFILWMLVLSVEEVNDEYAYDSHSNALYYCTAASATAS